MRNILRSELASIWNGTNKLNENRNGGIALWTLPPEMHNAYNPAMFVREKYLHLTEGYPSPHTKKPNYVSIDNVNGKIVFHTKTTSDLYLTATTVNGENTGRASFKVSKGKTEWGFRVFAERLVSIDSISMGPNYDISRPAEDTYCIYLKPEETYLSELYICKDADNIVYRNDSIDSYELTFSFDDGTKETLSAESFKGKTMYNASEIVKMKFEESLLDFRGVALVADPALFVRYRVNISGMTFMAVNGVSQVGCRSDRIPDAGMILTKMRVLKLYDGYPLDYAILSGQEAVETPNGLTEPKTVSRVLVYGGQHNGDSESLVQQINEKQIELGSDVRVYEECVPYSPFYVRWINSLGGIDYFMFGKTQKFSRSVKSVGYYNPFATNVEQAGGNIVPFSIQSEYKVTAGAKLNRNDYDSVSSIPFSPFIETYDSETGKWIRILVEKFDGEHETRGETKEVEITFTMPEINVQY